MKVSYKWLQQFIKEQLPPVKDLCEQITMASSEVEDLQQVQDDYVFDVKVLADRNHYLLSHRGLARELAAVAQVSLNPEPVKDVSTTNSITKPDVAVETKLCRRAMLRTFEIDQSNTTQTSQWIEKVGIRSISPIVDITNYVMVGMGQPLHAFDADKVKGKIVIRLAKVGETMELLPDSSGQPRVITFKGDEIIHADDEGPIDVAGVKGGLRTAVSGTTKRIILEAANFDPVSIRKTALKHNLRNDASKRFENNLSPYMAEEGMRWASHFFVTELKGKAGEWVDIHEGALPQPQTFTVSIEQISKRIGLSFTPQQIADVLGKARCTVKVGGNTLEITPPVDRHDLQISEDIADEVGRLSYGKLPGVLPEKISHHKPASQFSYIEQVKNQLVELGYTEIFSRSLGSKGEIKVAYPVASDKETLRANLLDTMLETVQFHVKLAPILGKETIKIFEIGSVFTKTGESVRLSVGIGHTKKQKGKDIEEEVKNISEQLSLKPLSSKVDATTVVYEWDITEAAKNAEAKLPVFGTGSQKIFTPFSLQPYIVRDIALFVPSSVSEKEVLQTIDTAARSIAAQLLVKGPDLFDRFEKDGKVSLAYRLVFQAMDRTLSTEETNGYMEHVYAAVKEKGWEVR